MFDHATSVKLAQCWLRMMDNMWACCVSYNMIALVLNTAKIMRYGSCTNGAGDTVVVVVVPVVVPGSPPVVVVVRSSNRTGLQRTPTVGMAWPMGKWATGLSHWLRANM